MVSFFKIVSKLTGNVIVLFELEVKGDNELDYLNSFKKNNHVKQIGFGEYEGLITELEEKFYFLDARP